MPPRCFPVPALPVRRRRCPPEIPGVKNNFVFLLLENDMQNRFQEMDRDNANLSIFSGRVASKEDDYNK